MKKRAMWMVLMAMVVTSLSAQEAESSETVDQQQIEQAIDEALARDGERVETVEVETDEWESEGWEEEEQVTEEPEYQEQEYQEQAEESQSDDGRQQREVQTLMSNGGGGYGALALGYTQVNNLPSIQMGASAAWIIGHGFGLGIAGVGFTSDFTPVGADYYALSGGYGGLVMEPIIMGWLPVHIALPVLIGGGGMASYATTTDPWDYDNMDPTFGEYSAFFIAEAGVELEFNMTKFFRLAMFGNYRWTTDLQMKPMYGMVEPSPYTVGPKAMHGWSAGLRFKFGSF
ncbi:MAG: hypothetical protein ABFS10_15140 [Bacteroidota bacterium]